MSARNSGYRDFMLQRSFKSDSAHRIHLCKEMALLQVPRLRRLFTVRVKSLRQESSGLAVEREKS